MRAIAHVLTLLVLFGATVPSSADERPIVLVNFTFNGNTCSRYGATRIAEGERFAQVVARAFANEFQFAVWRTKATLLRGETAEATLTVELRAEDEQRGRKRGVAYYVDYFRDAEMNGVKITNREMSSYIGKKAALYDWDSFARPCGEDLNFTTLLAARINDDIGVFRKAWIDNFLRYVPIAKVVPDVDDDHDDAVKLGVHWKPLHAGAKSQMELNIGGDVKAFLNPIAIHDADHDDPFICARVMSLKDANGVTGALIRSVLQSYRANKYVRLFMTEYELNRDTHNFHPVVIIPHPD